MSTLRRSTCCVGLVWLLGACGPVGPDYSRPKVSTPASYRLEEPWRLGTPRAVELTEQWWQAFNDPRLDDLEKRALEKNNTLAVAAARLEQARAQVAVATAGLYPEVRANANVNRFRISANRPQTSYSTPTSSTVQTDLLTSFSARYEADVFGRVRRSIEVAKASSEQTAADLQTLRLLVSSDLATNYVVLGELDNEIDVVRRALEWQRKALAFVTARHDAGAASGLDVAQQQAQIDATATQLELLNNQRGHVERVIATLVGSPASTFALEPKPLDMHAFAPPLGLPSDLLERRPDIASAERAMAAANAQIGVAEAAVYPSFILGPSYGYESRNFLHLFDLPSLVWAFGVSSSQLLFDGGRAKAAIRFAEAGYQATLASYKQVVLNAVQEVEDGLGSLQVLDRAHQQALASVESNRRLLQLASDRYAGGLATYLDVITAQQALLASARIRVQILGQQVNASVFLVKALGGGWHSEQQPVKTAVLAPPEER